MKACITRYAREYIQTKKEIELMYKIQAIELQFYYQLQNICSLEILIIDFWIQKERKWEYRPNVIK